MYAHRYDITLKGGIACWEGPMARGMCIQFLKTDVRP